MSKENGAGSGSGNKKKEINPRLGKVGGQAVLEGVMMKSGETVAICVRKTGGALATRKRRVPPLKDKYKWMGVPIVRGVVNFIEMLVLAMSTMTESAEMLEEGEGAPTEKGKKSSATAAASVIGAVLGLALAFVLFFYLPTYITSFIRHHVVALSWLTSLVEGIIRLLIFLIYIILVSLMRDIRRTFQYHGAEHMSVFCYEAGEKLVVENARKYSRFHPRCGTSFIIVMMIVGILISMLIPLSFTYLARLGVKILLFPFVIGLGFEFIRYAGRHQNRFVRIISAPGLWMQRLTTKPPDDTMLEVALVALRDAVGGETDGEEEKNDEIIVTPVD